MMLTQTSDADPFIVCAIPHHPGDLDPRTIEAAYENDAHYLGTLPAEYHLDIEQRELTKHPPAVDQVTDLLATLGFAAVQPFTAIAWTNRHEQPVVLVVAEQDRLPIGQCDHGLRQTITRRPFRGPVAHPGNPDAREGHTELEQCTHCGALRVVNVGPTDAREATAWRDPAPHYRTLAWSELYRALVGPHQQERQKMRRSVSRFTLVLVLSAILNALGCSDEVAVTLDEIEAVQQQILNLLEQRVEHTASAAAQAEAARAEAQIAFDQAPGYFNDGPFARDRQMTDADVNKRELTYALRSAEANAEDADGTHERAQLQLTIRASRYSEAHEALRRAHQDDTWDAFALARTGNSDVSARSIVVTYLRELEDERTRLENLAAESRP